LNRRCEAGALAWVDIDTNVALPAIAVALYLGENRMGRYLLSGLLLLAFSALNAFAAENPEKTAVGLGEVCDKRIGQLCKSSL
jgi:hypothetical protein